MVLLTCSHFESFKSNNALRNYKIIESNLVGAWQELDELRKMLSRCSICRYNGIHLHCCLHCVYFGCLVNGHMADHAKSKKHPLGIQLKFGIIRCFECNSNIYNEEILDNIQKNLVPGFSISHLHKMLQNRVNRLNDSVENPQWMYVKEGSSLGLRGLLNLGNTCFMNCIVQTLMHTPILRDYFLSDKHICILDQGTMKCLCCEFVNIYREFYSGKKTTLVLHRLLHLMWTNAQHLAGYEQQDAHEFLIATLDVLHKHITNTSSSWVTANTAGLRCSCIIDKIFTGLIQSDVVCQFCNGVSTTVEPFWDISLNINTSSSCESTVVDGNEPPILSLIDCLEQFTKSEDLGSASKIKCAYCNENQESTKQITMKKLPIILCLHLKRFEQTSRIHRKIGTIVQFPEELDLGRFTASYRNANENLMKSADPDSILTTPIFVPDSGCQSTKYSLFSVVNHRGSIDAGHYMAYIRLHTDEWYICNDDNILKVSLSEVLRSEGYLLFYHKKIFEYE